MKLTSEDNLGTRIKLDFFEEIYIYKNHIEIYEWDRQTKLKFTKIYCYQTIIHCRNLRRDITCKVIVQLESYRPIKYLTMLIEFTLRPRDLRCRSLGIS